MRFFQITQIIYCPNVAKWGEEQAQARILIERHEKADQNTMDQGIYTPSLQRELQLRE